MSKDFKYVIDPPTELVEAARKSTSLFVPSINPWGDLSLGSLSDIARTHSIGLEKVVYQELLGGRYRVEDCVDQITKFVIDVTSTIATKPHPEFDADLRQGVEAMFTNLANDKDQPWVTFSREDTHFTEYFYNFAVALPGPWNWPGYFMSALLSFKITAFMPQYEVFHLQPDTGGEFFVNVAGAVCFVNGE